MNWRVLVVEMTRKEIKKKLKKCKHINTILKTKIAMQVPKIWIPITFNQHKQRKCLLPQAALESKHFLKHPNSKIFQKLHYQLIQSTLKRILLQKEASVHESIKKIALNWTESNKNIKNRTKRKCSRVEFR